MRLSELPGKMKTLTIARPDDWHLHLRDGDILHAVIADSAAWAGRAIIMPNLVPPVVTSQQARDYQGRIMAALPHGADFTPLMTLYLTEQTKADDLVAGHKAGLVTAVKLYPAGATTNSASGVRDISAVMPVLEAMAEADIPLLIHGEVTDSEIDIFDREAVFIERVLIPLRTALPELRVVMEHITTSDAADYILGEDKNLAGTVTPHHLLINRNAYLAGGIQPHYYCLPVAKRETHRQHLVEAVMKDTAKLFLGTDSAPHTDPAKLQSCGCAGIYNAPNTMGCLAQLFEECNALDRLEGFTSVYGPRFYKLSVNSQTLTLIRHDEPVPVPEPVQTSEGQITPFDPKRDIFWSVQG